MLQRIDKETLLPIGVVTALLLSVVTGTWVLATDRAAVLSHIESLSDTNERQDRELQELRTGLNDLHDALRRVEIKLGTWPPQKGRT